MAMGGGSTRRSGGSAGIAGAATAAMRSKCVVIAGSSSAAGMLTPDGDAEACWQRASTALPPAPAPSPPGLWQGGCAAAPGWRDGTEQACATAALWHARSSTAATLATNRRDDLDRNMRRILVASRAGRKYCLRLEPEMCRQGSGRCAAVARTELSGCKRAHWHISAVRYFTGVNIPQRRSAV